MSTVWNEDGTAADGAGGGGISTVWTRPSYQTGFANSKNGASSTMRNVPDVALDADPSTGYAIYVAGNGRLMEERAVPRRFGQDSPLS